MLVLGLTLWWFFIGLLLGRWWAMALPVLPALLIIQMAGEPSDLLWILSGDVFLAADDVEYGWTGIILYVPFSTLFAGFGVIAHRTIAASRGAKS